MDEVLHCYRHPDRETRVSCSECGRGVCPDCMVFAPVGIRCLDHASQGKPAARPAMGRRARGARRGFLADELLVTKVLLGVNVAIFLVNLLQGATFGLNSGRLFESWFLAAGPVASGDWWRLLTAAFLHGGILHLAFNMYFLWMIGGPMEAALGRARFLSLYLACALAGSAGALLLDPNRATVGASGALFGVLGAAVVFEQQGFNVLGGQALGVAVINFVITLLIPNISLGGHAGGFVGGLLCGLALTRFGRGHASYGRLGAIGYATMVAVAVGSVLLAFWQVRGYT